MRLEGFDWTAISNYFQISREAWTRRLIEFQFVDPLLSVSDAVVDEAVLQYVQGRGEALIRGHLLSLGYHVPRQQMRCSISRIDSQGKAEARGERLKGESIRSMTLIISGI